jgi:signal transduction histidine kinase
VPLLAAYGGVAAILLWALRVDRLRGLAGAAVPIIDVLTVYFLQRDSMFASPFPAGVAGWSLGPFVFLVLLASLTLRPRLIYATAVAASICEGLLQIQAGVGPGAVVASAFVLLLAAGVTHWAAGQMERMLGRVVQEQVQARIASERGEAIERAHAALASAKGEIEAQHRKLLTAQREAEVLTSLLIHDMKGPLSTVLMRLELTERELWGKPELAKLGKDLKIAKVQGQRVLAMMQDLLAIARLERSGLSPQLREVSLVPLFASVATSHSALAQTLGVTIDVKAPEDLSARLDRELIIRVLENLVTNALRFLRGGDRLEVSASREQSGLSLAVRNTGPAIPAELRPGLFERFGSRAEGDRGNVGLGLYFCRLVAEAHGGSIALEEEPGWGVSFVLRLPLQATGS